MRGALAALAARASRAGAALAARARGVRLRRPGLHRGEPEHPLAAAKRSRRCSRRSRPISRSAGSTARSRASRTRSTSGSAAATRAPSTAATCCSTAWWWRSSTASRSPTAARSASRSRSRCSSRSIRFTATRSTRSRAAASCSPCSSRWLRCSPICGRCARAAPAQPRRAGAWLAASAAAFALACAAKETGACCRRSSPSTPGSLAAPGSRTRRAPCGAARTGCTRRRARALPRRALRCARSLCAERAAAARRVRSGSGCIRSGASSSSTCGCSCFPRVLQIDFYYQQAWASRPERRARSLAGLALFAAAAGTLVWLLLRAGPRARRSARPEPARSARWSPALSRSSSASCSRCRTCSTSAR